MPPDFFCPDNFIIWVFYYPNLPKSYPQKVKNKKFTQCLAGGGHSCYYNKNVDNYEKIKNFTGEFEFCSKI